MVEQPLVCVVRVGKAKAFKACSGSRGAKMFIAFSANNSLALQRSAMYW